MNILSLAQIEMASLQHTKRYAYEKLQHHDSIEKFNEMSVLFSKTSPHQKFTKKLVQKIHNHMNLCFMAHSWRKSVY